MSNLILKCENLCKNGVKLSGKRAMCIRDAPVPGEKPP